MHELNICLSLIRILEKQIEASDKNAQIKKIWIEVGTLTGIDIEALKFSFPIAALKTISEKAVLEIKVIAGRAQCNICNNNFIVKTLFDFCAQCQSYDLVITDGKELKITKIEVI